MAFSRRGFLQRAGFAGIAAAAPLQTLFARQAMGRPVEGYGFGELVPDPNGVLDLPPGFQYRAFSLTGDLMSDGTLVPGGHDGMYAFPGRKRTTILVRNHEQSPTSSTGVVAPDNKKFDVLSKGGTTTLIVSNDTGEPKLLKHYGSLAGTYRNCAGGPTPWGSWISCEENTSTPLTTSTVTRPHGYNFEVPAASPGLVDPVPLVAMGRFNHEAVAVDPTSGIVYQTEDQGNSLFYRFTPTVPGNLTSGVLEALVINGQPGVNTKNNFPIGVPFQVSWVKIDDVDPVADTVRVEGFNKGAARFSRGEGAYYANGEVYFVCTNGGVASRGQVWRYLPANNTIELFVEPNNESILDGPDNIVVAPFGDLFLMEDGNDVQFVVGVTRQGELYKFARNALNDNEFAGGTFSADGRLFFVNIQTPGITFAIWGPWDNRV